VTVTINASSLPCACDVNEVYQSIHTMSYPGRVVFAARGHPHLVAAVRRAATSPPAWPARTPTTQPACPDCGETGAARGPAPFATARNDAGAARIPGMHSPAPPVLCRTTLPTSPGQSAWLPRRPQRCPAASLRY